jgi:hypothetical protein
MVIEGANEVFTLGVRVNAARIVSPLAARVVASPLMVADGIKPTNSRPTTSAALYMSAASEFKTFAILIAFYNKKII